MHAYSQSISTIWLVNTPISGFGLLLVLFIRAYSLKRTIVRDGENELGDVEKGAEQATVEGGPEVRELVSMEKKKIPATSDDATDRTRGDSVDDTSSKEETEA